MRRGDGIALGLLKAAAGASDARAAGVAIAKGLKGVVGGAANLGGGVAHGLGAHEAVGKALGVTALGGAGYVGARKAKAKYDQAKFKLLYGNQQYY